MLSPPFLFVNSIIHVKKNVNTFSSQKEHFVL
nr:MAG TPA: hypothetical protein [Caudoviricetes sp.]